MIAREIGHFFVGMTFLTQLPAPTDLIHAEGRLARASRYFPLIGVLVGLAGGAVYFAGASVLPPVIAATMAVMVTILMTGGLHEDGFADCCDGLGGGRTREHILEIMRDSRLGTFGVCGLVGSILLRVAAIAALAPLQGFVALVVAHAVSRAMMVPVMVSSANARSRGLASSVAGGVTMVEALFAFGVACVVALAAGPVVGIAVIAAGVISAGLMLAQLMRRLGGYTGDGLGAIQQVSEITILVVIAGIWV